MCRSVEIESGQKPWRVAGAALLHQKLPPPLRNVRIGLIAGGALLALLLGFEVTGLRKPLQPGSVVSPHARIGRCEECHVREGIDRGASNVRCQRCHDAAGAGSRSLAAHSEQLVDLGRRPRRLVEANQDLPCARCHVEHRGARTPLDDIDEHKKDIVKHAVDNPDMPPKGSKAPSDKEREQLGEFIDCGPN